MTSIFLRHIYEMVFPWGNEWGTKFWMEHWLEGKTTLDVSLMDFEGIYFPIGMMVIKGEY